MSPLLNHPTFRKLFNYTALVSFSCQPPSVSRCCKINWTLQVHVIAAAAFIPNGPQLCCMTSIVLFMTCPTWCHVYMQCSRLLPLRDRPAKCFGKELHCRRTAAALAVTDSGCCHAVQDATKATAELAATAAVSTVGELQSSARNLIAAAATAVAAASTAAQ